MCVDADSPRYYIELLNWAQMRPLHDGGGACVCVVGGIYTVIRTKAAVTVEELGEQYCLVGPLNESCVRTEVEIMEPTNWALLGAVQHMREFGIKVLRRHFPTGRSSPSCWHWPSLLFRGRGEGAGVRSLDRGQPALLSALPAIWVSAVSSPEQGPGRNTGR